MFSYFAHTRRRLHKHIHLRMYAVTISKAM